MADFEITVWLREQAETLRERSVTSPLGDLWDSIAALVYGALNDYEYACSMHKAATAPAGKAYWSGRVEGSVRQLERLTTHVDIATGARLLRGLL